MEHLKEREKENAWWKTTIVVCVQMTDNQRKDRFITQVSGYQVN